MSTVKTYMLVPHHDLPAGGPLVLGSIIQDPLDPGDSLNEDERVYIPPATIHTIHHRDVEETIELIQDGRAGLLVHYFNLLLSLGGSVGGSFDISTTIRYRFEVLETTYFAPSQAYIEEAVNKSGVKAFLEGSSFKMPVYIVTGLKIVRGPGSLVTSRKSYGYEAHANTGPGPGILAGSPWRLDGGNLGLHQAGLEETSFRGSDFVIGYRLGKITFQKIGRKVEISKYEKKFTVGTLLGTKDGSRIDASEDLIAAKVMYGGEGAVAEELRENGFVPAFDEEDDQECNCIYVPKLNTRGY